MFPQLNYYVSIMIRVTVPPKTFTDLKICFYKHAVKTGSSLIEMPK